MTEKRALFSAHDFTNFCATARANQLAPATSVCPRQLRAVVLNRFEVLGRDAGR